jgi:hypothetical protein
MKACIDVYFQYLNSNILKFICVYVLICVRLIVFVKS